MLKIHFMKLLKHILFISGLILVQSSFAQKSPESIAGKKFRDKPSGYGDETVKESLNFTLGIGSANYYGDLMEDKSIYKQTSGPAISVGVLYEVNSFLNCGINLGFQKLQGADSKNGGAHPSRNLDFKSNVFNFTAYGELILLPKYNLRPVFSAGFGLITFDPYTQDATGRKVFLRELDTEGRGLTGNKGTYSNAAWVVPLGFGTRYSVNENFGIGVEYKYNFTGTDYLDDVSMNGYPNKALLDARNPVTSKFTYRGEGEYPKNLALPRGNPNNKDGFYTVQLKFLFSL